MYETLTNFIPTSHIFHIILKNYVRFSVIRKICVSFFLVLKNLTIKIYFMQILQINNEFPFPVLADLYPDLVE
jgi:hypothetical protein